PDALYQQGLETFKSGDTQKARELFVRFIELFPANGMLANAHYWLGETYYSEKKYDQAILEFQEVIKNHPGKEKVPAAMLKQGMAFKGLGDEKSARYLYKKLIEDFPSSEEAKLAREKLKDLK
ncbi:MAG TPA: tol-pal system protein YbgF, partial [Geobacteraceae bacterium]|nr:tol-pal system protein YbgF [Geobacteraceae bacterium]